MTAERISVPSVSVSYARTGRATRANDRNGTIAQVTYDPATASLVADAD